MAAVVASDEAAGAVKDERHIALRTDPHVTARSAGQEVRPAATVEQDDRFLAGAPD